MTIQLGQIAPDFEQDTTAGRIRFHDWAGDNRVVLSSHPRDWTSRRAFPRGGMRGSATSSWRTKRRS